MNMVVCCKQVQDPEAPPVTFRIDAAARKAVSPPGVAPVISPFDEQAVEAALRVKDAKGGKITIISMGKEFVTDVVKKPLSMGADELILLQDPSFEEGDSFIRAQVLAAAIKKVGNFDLIFCGRQAADWDSGQVGSGLAELLGLPSVTVAKKVEVVDGKVRVERVVADGYEVVEAPIPALITVSNELGEPRYATLKGIMAAARKPIITWKAADLGIDPAKLVPLTKLLKLFIPTRQGKCEVVEGETPADAGARLALRLREAKLI